MRVVGKEEALGAGGGWELQQRHGWRLKDNEVISVFYYSGGFQY